MNSVPLTEPTVPYRDLQVPPSRSSGIAFYILVVLLFVLYSRVFDFFPVPLVAMFIFIVALAATAFSGRLAWLFHPRISRLWVILTGWLAVSAALSIWKSGSGQTLSAWLKSLSVYFVTLGLITTIDQCYRAVRAVAWAIGMLAVLSFVYGDTTSGRFFLDTGKFQGPNELAQVLLIGIPLLWLVFSRSPRISLKRLLVLGLLLIVVSVLLRTASRGAMITAAVMALVVLVDSRSKGKAIVLLCVGSVIVVGGLALSDSARSRYLTFFSPGVEQGTSKQVATMEETATASADQRWQLLLESLAITAEHPLTGVGPGMFAEARERRAHREGTHVPFLVTHNTYTEFSAEAGIPAAVLFIAILVGCYWSARRVERLVAGQPAPRMQDAARIASALKFSILAFGVSALFLSVAYQSFLETLAGLVVALEYTVMTELASQAPRRTQTPTARTPLKPHLPITPVARVLRSRR
jgi:O-antigen ligase